MGLKLEKVVPWGRSLEEYIAMFHLTASDRQLAILDCAGGPSSFNTEMTSQGNKVISCDPIYQFSSEEIAQQIQEIHPIILKGLKDNLDNYRWIDFESPEQLCQVRIATMQKFIEDLPQGLAQGRYVNAELPSLPFSDQQFDLALCGHFLFSYSDHFSERFLLNSILELCRVAKEVRIFSLVKVSGELSPLVSPITAELKARGYIVEVQEVCYEFQKGGNKMLQVFSERSHRKL